MPRLMSIWQAGIGVRIGLIAGTGLVVGAIIGIKAIIGSPAAPPDTTTRSTAITGQPITGASPTSDGPTATAASPSSSTPATPTTDKTAKTPSAGQSARPVVTPTTPTTTTVPSAPLNVPAAPASPPVFRANCYVTPSACGYPDATNTGVPSGVTLTASAPITVTQDGTVINGKNVTGQIVVNANNVTIKNTRITSNYYYPIDYNGHTGLVVEDTEIIGTSDIVTAGISFGSFTARRVHISGTSDGLKADINALIEDSYIHGLAVTQSSHNDGVQSTGGSNVTVRHNTFSLGSAGVCVQFGSSDSGWTVTNNLFNCTGWMLNGSAGTSNSTFTGNRFTRLNGTYGPASINGSNISWSGNYYDNDGATANL